MGAAEDSIKIQTLENGKKIDISVKWPEIMVDCDMLHKFLRMEGKKTFALPEYHPKIIACHNTLIVVFIICYPLFLLLLLSIVFSVLL